MLPDLYLIATFHTWNYTNPNLQCWTNPTPGLLLIPDSVYWCSLHLASHNKDDKDQNMMKLVPHRCGLYLCPYGRTSLVEVYLMLPILYMLLHLQSWMAFHFLLTEFLHTSFHPVSNRDSSVYCHDLGSLIYFAVVTHFVKLHVKVFNCIINFKTMIHTSSL